MSWRMNKSKINGAQMIDVGLVNDGRRLMNSKGEKRTSGKTACRFIVLTFDRMNDDSWLEGSE